MNPTNLFAESRGWNWQHALGELAIVVVGILIALAVNDWAQGRRDRALETGYLERLLADTTGNLATIQERMAMHTRRADPVSQRGRSTAALRDASVPPRWHVATAD